MLITSKYASPTTLTAQKMKISIKNFFSKCDQICWEVICKNDWFWCLWTFYPSWVPRQALREKCPNTEFFPHGRQWNLYFSFLTTLIGQESFHSLLKHSNSDMKIYLYLHLHIKMIYRRFRNITTFSVPNIRSRIILNVSLQTYRNNRIC